MFKTSMARCSVQELIKKIFIHKAVLRMDETHYNVNNALVTDKIKYCTRVN